MSILTTNQLGMDCASPRTLRRGPLAAVCSLFAAATLTAAPAAAQDAAADSQAEIVDGFNLINTQPLDFGTVVPSGLGGVIVVEATDGSVSTVGDIYTVGTGQQRARFQASAPIGTTLVLSGDDRVTLTRLTGTETMEALLFYEAGAGVVPTLVFGLPIGLAATGTTQEIWVGGSLTVDGAQAEGIYDGTFTLEVAYL